ncbi:MAG: hypothetical protein ACRD30_07395 [Bryobacteraceae bacterium]
MRKGDLMTRLFRLLAAGCWLLASGSWLLASVDGVVMNATTSQPQASVKVNLLQPGSSGMKTLATVQSDADGKFKIDEQIPPGPAILQADYQGATYNVVLTPGTPTSGVTVNIYNATTDPATGTAAQGMILIEPSATTIQVGETFLFENSTKLSYVNEKAGSLRFYVPKDAANVDVTVNAPGGMPIRRPAEKTSKVGIFKIGYPIKPGETRFDINYSLPAGDTFAGKNPDTSIPIRLVTPPAVTLSGDGLQSLGQEPKTQAHIYQVSGSDFTLKIDGAGSLRNPETANTGPDSGAPQLEVKPARIYGRLDWVLALTLGILALGGVMLFRRGSA